MCRFRVMAVGAGQKKHRWFWARDHKNGFDCYTAARAKHQNARLSKTSCLSLSLGFGEERTIKSCHLLSPLDTRACAYPSQSNSCEPNTEFFPRTKTSREQFDRQIEILTDRPRPNNDTINKSIPIRKKIVHGYQHMQNYAFLHFFMLTYQIRMSLAFPQRQHVCRSHSGDHIHTHISMAGRRTHIYTHTRAHTLYTHGWKSVS